MTCRDFERFWIARSSDELPPAVQAHLAGCPDCAALVQADTATNAFLRRVRTARPPVDTDLAWTAIEGELEERSRQTSGIVWHRPLTLAVTGLACVAVVAALLWGYTRATKNSGSKTVSSSTGGRGGETGDPSATVLAPDPRSLSRSLVGRHDADADTTAPPAPARATGRHAPRRRVPRPQSPIADDLVYVNRAPEAALRQRLTLPQDDRSQILTHVRRNVPVRDDFVQIPFPRIADVNGSQMAAAVEGYQREAAIVDPRLSHEVTCAFKATALSDLCDRLRSDTGIQLGAGSSVADEKVTLFCEKLPLREVMRQLSRPFGYAWLRSGKTGEYKYELVQDLRSQLLEEELCNKDRNEALLALDREIERYRPYLDLSPDEALARSKSAPPAKKPLLETLADKGWGAVHVYFRLSNGELAALRAGQELAFSQEPKPGEHPLPQDLALGVIQSNRHLRLRRHEDGKGGYFVGGAAGKSRPDDVVLTAIPEVRASVSLKLSQSELGQHVLLGGAAIYIPDGPGEGSSTSLAMGRSPAVLKPDNQGANAALAGDPALRPLVTVQPLPSCRPAPPVQTAAATPNAADGNIPEPKVTTADVLEALHRASGRPIAADYYTRLYPASEVSARNVSLFAALNRLADTMRLRWSQDGRWLQFRSTCYYDDRIKEVPNRLLEHWAAARQRQGMLTLDNLVEIAQLADAQLDGEEIAEGARDCVGLKEWDLPRNGSLRPHLRYLAGFTRAQRQEAMTAAGFPFAKMSLAQQQQFIAHATTDHALSGPFKSLDELEGATLRVEYTQPGWYQWGVPGATWGRWALVDPARPDRWVPRPMVRARTREAVMEAVRHLDPQIRDWASPRPAGEAEPPSLESQVFPTDLSLMFVYFPNARTGRLVHIIRDVNYWDLLGK